MNHFDRTLEFFDQLRHATTAAEIMESLLTITAEFSLTVMMGGAGPQSGVAASREETASPAGLGETAYHCAYDPANPTKPERRNRDSKESRATTTASESMSGPLVTLDGQTIVVSLGGDTVELSPDEFGMVSLAASYAIGQAMQSQGKPTQPLDNVELTPRELECLQWAAIGKSEWEISQILGISEHTSEKHLLNAKTKLGAVNRVQAVAEAIRRGYIS